ncbi:MAG: STAS domain-containing protein [Desulfobacterales bacterium]|nr:STAS domain-containing protein [Desulfobacterales bacterium]
MNDSSFLSGLKIQIVNNCLLVPVNGAIDDDSVIELRKKILEKVKATCAKGVLIDLASVKVIDAFTFSILVETARMISILGARVIFIGIQAGVASALVDLDVDFGNIYTGVTMEDGFDMLQSK